MKNTRTTFVAALLCAAVNFTPASAAFQKSEAPLTTNASVFLSAANEALVPAKTSAAVPGRPIMNAIGYWENEPAGGVARPYMFSPQQVAAPSACTAQV